MRTLSLRKSLVAIGLCAVVALVIVGCSSTSNTNTPSTGGTGTTAPAAGTTITEKNFAFSPADATVKVGETVTFTNEDSAPHNVSIDGKELGSQDPGASVTWTPTKAGTYPYSCVIHPTMTGQITVQ